MPELALDTDRSVLATMADAVEGYAAAAGVPAERALQRRLLDYYCGSPHRRQGRSAT